MQFLAQYVLMLEVKAIRKQEYHYHGQSHKILWVSYHSIKSCKRSDLILAENMTNMIFLEGKNIWI